MACKHSKNVFIGWKEKLMDKTLRRQYSLHVKRKTVKINNIRFFNVKIHSLMKVNDGTN